MHSESAAEEVNGKIVNGDGTIEWKLLFHWNGSWNSEARDVYIPFLLPPKYERQKKDIGSWRMKDVEKNWTVFETCSQCEPYSMCHNSRNAESELMQHPKSIRKPVQLSFHGVFVFGFLHNFSNDSFSFWFAWRLQECNSGNIFPHFVFDLFCSHRCILLFCPDIITMLSITMN